MKYLNPQIEKLAKAKRQTLAKGQISCGIFQDLEPNGKSTETKKPAL